MKYEEFLARYCHCYPDEAGNMPCDNGVICDKCMTSEMIKSWRYIKSTSKMETTVTAKVWEICPACPCNGCSQESEDCDDYCQKYQAWRKVREAFDRAEDLAAEYLDNMRRWNSKIYYNVQISRDGKFWENLVCFCESVAEAREFIRLEIYNLEDDEFEHFRVVEVDGNGDPID